MTRRPCVLFWAVVCSPTFQHLAWFDLHREAKVSQFDVHLIIQEDVLWLQVPMDNALAVEELHHLHQSSHNLPSTNTKHWQHFKYNLFSRWRSSGQGINWAWPGFLLTQSNFFSQVVEKFPPLHSGGEDVHFPILCCLILSNHVCFGLKIIILIITLTGRTPRRRRTWIHSSLSAVLRKERPKREA